MNPEYNTLIQWSISIFGVAIASIFYAWGGISGKWRRRFIGSFIILLSVLIPCLMRKIWTPWLLLIFPMTSGAWSLPYGGDKLGTKVIKRAIFAAAAVMSGLIFCLIFGGNCWWLFIPHVGVAAWSIYMGVKNPIEATAEQGAICVLLSLILACYPYCIIRG